MQIICKHSFTENVQSRASALYKRDGRRTGQHSTGRTETGGNPILPHFVVELLENKVGGIVFLAHVTELHMFPDGFAGMYGQKFGCHMIGQVTGVGEDPFFEIQWIRPFQKTLLIVIRLQDKVVGFEQERHRFVVDTTHIGRNDHRGHTIRNAVADNVGGVMADRKGRNPESGHFFGRTLGHFPPALVQFLRYFITAVHAVEHLGGGENRDMVHLAQRTYGGDVVEMIVCKENRMDLRQIHAYVLQILSD